MVASDDNAPSISPIETREVGVDRARDRRSAENALLVRRAAACRDDDDGQCCRKNKGEEDGGAPRESDHQNGCPMLT